MVKPPQVAVLPCEPILFRRPTVYNGVETTYPALPVGTAMLWFHHRIKRSRLLEIQEA